LSVISIFENGVVANPLFTTLGYRRFLQWDIIDKEDSDIAKTEIVDVTQTQLEFIFWGESK
jgi:hypothetical protein